MNKRLTMLAASHFPRDTDGQIYATPKMISEFAELIVKQCISMADEFEMDVNRSGLVDKMKEYFGVE